MNREHTKPDDQRTGDPGRTRILTFRSVLWAPAGIAATIALGYGAMSLVYRLTGEPPPLVANILSGLVGLLLMGCIGKLAMGIHWRQHQHQHNRYGGMRTQLLDQTIEAMERIAHGDFSVLVPVNDRDPFNHLAESVNQMARELGSMENLRQDFISNVSREIQSPLTSISGFAAPLRKEEMDKVQRAHYLDIIETETKRMSELSDNLLKLSSLESELEALTMSAFPLYKQIESAVLLLEPQWAAKQLELEVSLDRIGITGNESLLSQVWINLLHNAVKFTPERGEIHIILVEEEDRAGALRLW